MGMPTGLNSAEVLIVLQQMSQSIVHFNGQGTPVKLPVVAAVSPSIDRDGMQKVNLGVDAPVGRGTNAARRATRAGRASRTPWPCATRVTGGYGTRATRTSHWKRNSRASRLTTRSGIQQDSIMHRVLLNQALREAGFVGSVTTHAKAGRRRWRGSGSLGLGEESLPGRGGWASAHQRAAARTGGGRAGGAAASWST